MAKKHKEAGRPAGAPNRGNSYSRTCKTNIRVTEGFKQTIQLLIEAEPGKSEADLIHEALQQFAVRKVNTKKGIYWVNRIL